jgi:hypothetical protein
MRNLLIAIALIGALFLVKQIVFPSQNEPEAEQDDSGKAIYETAASISGIDASALDALPERLEKSCARNKFGLTEEQCIAALRTRHAACAQQTAQKFPGQLSTADGMQATVNHYVGCVFQGQ